MTRFWCGANNSVEASNQYGLMHQFVRFIGIPPVIHNIYILLGAEIGIPGVLTFLGFSLFPAHQGVDPFKAETPPRHPAFLLGAMASGGFAYLAADLFGPGLEAGNRLSVLVAPRPGSAAHPSCEDTQRRRFQHRRVQMSNRELDLDIMRGIHRHGSLLPFDQYRFPGPASRWFQTSYFTLQLVMMPSFMFVSGIVYSLSDKRPDCLKAYLDLTLKRIKRLLIPFILFSTIIFLGKLVLQQFATLEKTVALRKIFEQIILTPKASAFGSYFWFIYVLLEYTWSVSISYTG